MPAKGGPVPYGYYWWLYPERHLFEAWGGAGQRIAVISDLKIIIVMTANDSTDYPRSPLAAHIYDLVRASVKSSERLPPHASATSKLAQVLATLSAR